MSWSVLRGFEGEILRKLETVASKKVYATGEGSSIKFRIPVMSGHGISHGSLCFAIDKATPPKERGRLGSVAAAFGEGEGGCRLAGSRNWGVFCEVDSILTAALTGWWEKGWRTGPVGLSVRVDGKSEEGATTSAGKKKRRRAGAVGGMGRPEGEVASWQFVQFHAAAQIPMAEPAKSVLDQTTAVVCWDPSANLCRRRENCRHPSALAGNEMRETSAMTGQSKCGIECLQRDASAGVGWVNARLLSSPLSAPKPV